MFRLEADEHQPATTTWPELPISRRDLLKGAAAGALGLAATGLAMPGSALAHAKPVKNFRGTISMIPWAFYPNVKSPNLANRPTSANPFPSDTIVVLAREWQRLHPDVKFNWIQTSQANSAYLTYMTTQITGGTEPDIFFWWPASDEFVPDHAQINLEPYLKKPNHYVPGNKQWWDVFTKGVRSPRWWNSPYGGLWGVPVDWFDTALMVNADALDKVGVDPHHPWNTWADMMDVCVRLQKKGYRTPFSGDALWSWWPRGIIGDMIMPLSVFHEADFQHRGVGLGLDEEETVLAYYRGIYHTHAPWFVEYLKIMKDWSRFFPAGWFNQSFASTNPDYFIKQEEVIDWTSAWSYTSVQRNPLRKFAFVMSYFPPITKATTPLAQPGAQARSVGGPGDCFAVSVNARKSGALEDVIDFLMFLTTPKNDGYLVGGQPYEVDLIPAVAGAPTRPAIAPMMKIVDRGPVLQAIPWGASTESGNNMDQIFDEYILGTATLNETLTKMQAQFKAGAEHEIQKNQHGQSGVKWNLKQWHSRWGAPKW